MNPLVSICIPAYRQPELLERCLTSVLAQTYKRVEVLITDDSPEEDVKIVVECFRGKLNITYVKNTKPLGSPANWNEALQLAKGEYIMLLHHDDAFASEKSLAVFLSPFRQDPTPDFVFARNPTVERLSDGKPFDASFFFKFYRSPDLLLAGNVIGAPSNVLLKASAVEWYNTKYKWIVDIEFYIRLFRKRRRFFYIDQKLIDIGIHSGQVSNDCADNHTVLLYENISYAAENNLQIINGRLYDFYWRLLRNAGTRRLSQLTETGLQEAGIPSFIRQMVSVQQKFPPGVLRNGFASKALMAMSYLYSRFAQALA
jgi:glycosyltransferase involved in cell wall biosynthesis